MHPHVSVYKINNDLQTAIHNVYIFVKFSYIYEKKDYMKIETTRELTKT